MKRTVLLVSFFPLLVVPAFAQEAPPSAGAELQANVQNTLGTLTLQNMQCNAGLNELRRQVASLQAELEKAKATATPAPATPPVPTPK